MNEAELKQTLSKEKNFVSAVVYRHRLALPG